MSPTTPNGTHSLARRIRTHALRMTSIGGGSHIGAIFSCTDILAVLYGGILNVDPAAAKHANRDRFVLSKGHAGAGLYAALAERGFFPVEKLLTHYQDGSDLCGHVSHGSRTEPPGSTTARTPAPASTSNPSGNGK